jgi:hypothetical protein
MDTSVLNGLLTTVFTSACFIAYKIIKRYTLKSSCVNNELHITVKDLNEKVDATHEFIKMITLELVNGVNQYKKQQEGTITPAVETEDMKETK